MSSPPTSAAKTGLEIRLLAPELIACVRLRIVPPDELRTELIHPVA